MVFEDEYEVFLTTHQKQRSGPRLERIVNGLGHAEFAFVKNVWWPLFHDFKNLHPEYEVRDYKDGTRYIDFAYVQPTFHIAIEIDGISTHWREITQDQFIEHCQRQNALVIDGWYPLRFAFESVKKHPRICQQTIQQLLGKWQSQSKEFEGLSLKERETVRLIGKSLSPVTPGDVSRLLGTSTDHARDLLHQLADKRWVTPASGSVRYRAYRLHRSRAHLKW